MARRSDHFSGSFGSGPEADRLLFALPLDVLQRR